MHTRMSNRENVLGRTIRGIREHLGLTQPEFAQELGFNRAQTVSDWENGKRVPSRDTLARIARLAGRTCAEVFGDVEVMIAEEDLKQRSPPLTLEEIEEGYVPEAEVSGEGDAPAGGLSWLPALINKVVSAELDGRWQAALVAEINAAARTQVAWAEADAAKVRAAAMVEEGTAANGRADAQKVAELNASARAAEDPGWMFSELSEVDARLVAAIRRAIREERSAG